MFLYKFLDGKPRTEKISTHIKKKNAKFIKQDSADKGISTDKPKKEKKKLPKVYSCINVN